MRGNVHQRLRVAVETLSTGQGRLQERLSNAAVTLIALRPEEFHDPKERKRFNAVIDALTAEGPISVTCALLNDEHAQEIASDIVCLATWAQAEYYGARAIRDASYEELVGEALHRQGWL